jgi:CDP-paratose 2-epimerase
MIFDETRPVLITGGAGFIGTNLAERLLRGGQPVLVLDNLSRAGSEENLRWLRRTLGRRLDVMIADIRDPQAVRTAVRRSCRVFHFAAQVAVTTSLADPLHDFEVNAAGTLNLLEAIRQAPFRPPLLYTSTNKVYGTLRAVDLVLSRGEGRDRDRYLPTDPYLAAHGLNEHQPLDFHSPYGCSKGTADQYVLDYSRVFGLSAVVFRMSCIYGAHQRGNEDQGWVAHFLLKMLEDQPITVFGDGRQVRDLLYVDDLIDAMLAAQSDIDNVRGQAFNVGGGVENAVSVREVLGQIAGALGRAPRLDWQDWRAADQRYYVSNVERLNQALGWRPQVSVAEGLRRLTAWLLEARAQATRQPVALVSDDTAAVGTG